MSQWMGWEGWCRCGQHLPSIPWVAGAWCGGIWAARYGGGVVVGGGGMGGGLGGGDDLTFDEDDSASSFMPPQWW